MSFRPLDLVGPNSIVNAYLGGMESVRRQKELELEKERLSQEKELRKQQLKQEHEYQQGELGVRGRQLDLESKMHELAMLQAKQQIGEAVTKGAPLPPGSQTTGIDYGPTDETPKTMSFTHPVLGQMTVEHPEEFKRSLIEQTGKLSEAKEAAERKTKFGVADLTSQREALLEYIKSIQKNIQEDARNQNRIDVANINAKARLDAARARGTSQRTATLASGINNHVDNHQITKDFQVLKATNDFVNTGNPNDYDLLLAYGKALTPSQNGLPVSNMQIMQELPSIADKLGLKWDSITANKQFLDKVTKEHIFNTIKNRFNFQQKAYDSLRQDATKRLQTLGEDPANWLSDYSKTIEENKQDLSTHSDQDLLDIISGKEPTKINENIDQNKEQTVAERHNNPLNLKLGSATQKLIDAGVAQIGEKAKDGGNFLKFKNSDEGFQAALNLLNSNIYSNLTVEDAMERWSGGGYGADILPKNIDAKAKLGTLGFMKKAELIKAMAKREGFQN